MTCSVVQDASQRLERLDVDELFSSIEYHTKPGARWDVSEAELVQFLICFECFCSYGNISHVLTRPQGSFQVLRQHTPLDRKSVV